MEQKEENGDGNVEAAATRMQADAAIGAGSEPRPGTSADMTGGDEEADEKSTLLRGGVPKDIGESQSCNAGEVLDPAFCSFRRQL